MLYRIFLRVEQHLLSKPLDLQLGVGCQHSNVSKIRLPSLNMHTGNDF